MRCQLWLLVMVLCVGCEGAKQIADVPATETVPRAQYEELELRFERLKADYQRLGRADAERLQLEIQQLKVRHESEIALLAQQKAELDLALEKQAALSLQAADELRRLEAAKRSRATERRQASEAGAVPQSNTYTADNHDLHLSEERLKVVSNQHGIATFSYHFKVHRAVNETVRYGITLQFLDDTDSVLHEEYLGAKSLPTDEDLVRGTCDVASAIANRVSSFTYHLD